jgi:hypothetical protein
MPSASTCCGSRNNSTTNSYEEHFKAYLLPAFGDVRVRKLTNAELQAFFNSLRVSPKYRVDSRNVAGGSEPCDPAGTDRQESGSWR